MQGLFQAGREEHERNSAPLPFAAAGIGFVVLTHAHIDHSGLLPKLTRAGFSGPIHTTAATADLLAIMLPDSGHIQEGSARRRARDRRDGKRSRSEPLYTVADAQACLKQISRHDYDRKVLLDPQVRCCFRDAGHILGSAILELWVEEHGETRKLVFSGDLGQPGRPILREPEHIDDADFLFIESTYGDRTHDCLDDTLDQLTQVVDRTLRAKRGCLVIPSFAVGRTQEIIYYLHDLTRQGRLDGLQIFVDSPMATEVTQLTMRHLELFDEQAKRLAAWRASGHGLAKHAFHEERRGIHRPQPDSVGRYYHLRERHVRGGAIKHHLRHRLPNGALLSGAIIILLALWMIWRTWSDRHAARAHSHDHGHHHDHEHAHAHGHSHDHDHGAAAGDSRTVDTGHGHVALALVPRVGQRFWQFTALSGQFWAPGEVTVTARPAQGGAERHYAFRVVDGVLLSATPVDLPEDFTARLTLSHRGHAHHYELAFGAADLAGVEGLDLDEDGYQDAHERAHAADIQRRFKGQTVTNGQILLFGLTGGLLPCPAAITVLLICLQLKEIPLGAVLVLCFSIGLALVLVGVGAGAAIGAHRASRLSPRLAALAGRAPYLSGALIILVGLYVGAHGAVALYY